MIQNIALYPWYKFVRSLVFWQAVWFLYFEAYLSASEAILLYVVADITTTALEVPSGYISDKFGRRFTIIAAALCVLVGAAVLIAATTFVQFALGNGLIAAGAAFASGTDSALLYESLKAEGRETEIEAAELTAWRAAFAGSALSALLGGASSILNESMPYVMTTVSAAIVVGIAWMFREPETVKPTTNRESIGELMASFKQPVLIWLLCLSLLMYVFSHVPYVFGQPFIREALGGIGYSDQTPLISGAVTFSMMVISLLTSVIAVPLRRRLGMAGLLLCAFGMQIALTAALAISNSIVIVGLLLLRMIPDSLSRPFILARIQPLLTDGIRATYLSVQSLLGRLLFAVTLSVAASNAPTDGAASYPDVQRILTFYAVAGLIALIALIIASRKVSV